MIMKPSVPLKTGPADKPGLDLTSVSRPPNGRAQAFPIGTVPESKLAEALEFNPCVIPTGQGQTNTELVQTILLPLANHFLQMQEQTFCQFSRLHKYTVEHFQETLLTVVQKFGGLQEQQFAYIRQELNRLHQLVLELQALQPEFTSHATNAAPITSSEPYGSADNCAWQAVPEPGAHEQASIAGSERPTEIKAGRLEANQGTSPPVGGQGINAPRPSPVTPDPDMHNWLDQRLANVQEERQSRWRSIVDLILGRTGSAKP
jgi:hypothetical protein